MLFAALRGREAEARALIDATIKDATIGGEGLAVQYAQWTNAVLDNGLGRYEDAMAAAEQASEVTPELFIGVWALPELIEAAIDLGDFRQVQMTPPRSQTSIHFGKGITTMEPGSLEKLYLAVKDVDAAREDLVRRGIDVSEVEEPPKPPGFDLPGRSYFAYASFSDPDGNSWLLQEVTTRIPGRGWDD